MDLEQEVLNLKKKVAKLEQICDPAADSSRSDQKPDPKAPESFSEDLPQQARTLLALHQTLKSRPLLYVLAVLMLTGWSLPLILDHALQSGEKVKAITELLPKGVPKSEVEDGEEIVSQLDQIKAEAGAHLVFLGEYYANRQHGTIQMEIKDQFWRSIEPKPPILLPDRDVFEANLVGDCHVSQDKSLARIGLTALIACPIIKPKKVFVAAAGFIELPKDRQGIKELINFKAQEIAGEL